MDLQTKGGNPVTSENVSPPNNFRAYSPQIADHSRLQPDNPQGAISVHRVAQRRRARRLRPQSKRPTVNNYRRTRGPDRSATRPWFAGVRDAPRRVFGLDLVLPHAPSVWDFREEVIVQGPLADVIPSTTDFEMHPIGLTSIAAYLEANNYDTRLVNLAYRMLRNPGFDFRARIARLKAPVFATTSSISSTSFWRAQLSISSRPVRPVYAVSRTTTCVTSGEAFSQEATSSRRLGQSGLGAECAMDAAARLHWRLTALEHRLT